MVSVVLKAAFVNSEWPGLPHDMSESSAAVSPLRPATSTLSFSKQIGPPSLREKMIITPIPRNRFLI
uniref:Uncharacterized protein n=1 Tax=Angiostrongylus cantonensis TaxID=6313 RepID=A0A0K0CTK5_ANGCA